jgi:hypothetical protein
MIMKFLIAVALIGLPLLNTSNAQQTVGSCYADYLYGLNMTSMFTPAEIDLTDKELQQWVMNFCTESTNNSGFEYEKFKEKYGIPKALLDMQDQMLNPNN